MVLATAVTAALQHVIANLKNDRCAIDRVRGFISGTCLSRRASCLSAAAAAVGCSDGLTVQAAVRTHLGAHQAR
jgi:hypothetical protein